MDTVLCVNCIYPETALRNADLYILLSEKVGNVCNARS